MSDFHGFWHLGFCLLYDVRRFRDGTLKVQGENRFCIGEGHKKDADTLCVQGHHVGCLGSPGRSVPCEPCNRLRPCSQVPKVRRGCMEPRVPGNSTGSWGEGLRLLEGGAGPFVFLSPAPSRSLPHQQCLQPSRLCVADKGLILN